MKTRKQHAIEWAVASFVTAIVLSPFAAWFGQILASSGRYPG